MYAEYAKDPRMRANVGIRRRLAPLLDNDRHQIELFTALLLSLPGSPVLYYGDEIGMGDNIWLGDRDGVRTPMQWTPDRNAGFSACRPAAGCTCRRSWTRSTASRSRTSRRRCALAILAAAVDAAHDRGPQAVPGVRPGQPPRAADSGNPAVLAFVREYGDDVVLCVEQPLPVRAAGGTGPERLRRAATGRADRRGPLPGRSASCRTC